MYITLTHDAVVFFAVGAFALCVTTCSCMYSGSDDVVELNPNNFHNLVINGDELWIVEFYAPW